jgi:hypothetical protein
MEYRGGSRPVIAPKKLYSPRRIGGANWLRQYHARSTTGTQQLAAVQPHLGPLDPGRLRADARHGRKPATTEWGVALRLSFSLVRQY